MQHSSHKPACEVLWSDNHFVAMVKPGGMLTQPNDSPDSNAEQWAKDWVRREKNKPGDVYLHAVHRLDRCVEGIVLFARTSKALSRINALMRGNEIEKTYHALVQNPPSQDAGSLCHWLRHGSYRAEVVTAGDVGAKKAVLEYRVVARRRNDTLLAIRLVTGRYHQIRAQLAAAGFPIIGDTLYGGHLRGEWSHSSIALAHTQMVYMHPVGEARRIEIGYQPAWMKE